MANIKREHSYKLSQKRPTLADFGYDAIITELYSIMDICGEITFDDGEEDPTLLHALDDDEESVWEFKMAFSDLTAKSADLYHALHEAVIQEEYDDCLTALLGKRYQVLGFNNIEEDYFALMSYDKDLALTEAGKRVMRHTKAEMLSIIGQCFGVLISFLDLKQSYDYLKATLDILRDENMSLLQRIKEIDAAYQAANNEHFSDWGKSTEKFDELLIDLPDVVWLG